MRKLSILMFITLDGVMQAPNSPMEDQSHDFKLGGWAKKYWEEVIAQAGREAFSIPSDMLFGRKTYELFYQNNSNQNNEGAPTPFDMAKKYVVSNSKKELEWKNSVLVSGNAVEEIAKLKSQDGPLLQLYGSWELVQTLLKNDLIDEYMIWTFPVIVGNGKRLFSNNDLPQNLALVKSEPTSNGVVMNLYKRV